MNDELKAKYSRIANDPSQLEMFKNDQIDINATTQAVINDKSNVVHLIYPDDFTYGPATLTEAGLAKWNVLKVGDILVIDSPFRTFMIIDSIEHGSVYGISKSDGPQYNVQGETISLSNENVLSTTFYKYTKLYSHLIEYKVNNLPYGFYIITTFNSKFALNTTNGFLTFSNIEDPEEIISVIGKAEGGTIVPVGTFTGTSTNSYGQTVNKLEIFVLDQSDMSVSKLSLSTATNYTDTITEL